MGQDGQKLERPIIFSSHHKEKPNTVIGTCLRTLGVSHSDLRDFLSKNYFRDCRKLKILDFFYKHGRQLCT